MPVRDGLVAVNCDYCGSDNHRLICIRSDKHRVVECCRCGLAFLNPRPNDRAIRNIYDDCYFEGNGITGYRDYNAVIRSKLRFTELDLLEQHVQLNGKRIVEIGCASGALLADARDRGAVVVGVELSREAAARAVKDRALEMHIGSIEEVSERLGSFDVAIACEVIEHVPRPTVFLRTLASIVKPGGHLLLTTPNYRCARRFGDNWFGFQASFEHLYFLSDEVLSRMAAAAGFRELCWFTSGAGVSPRPRPIYTALKKCMRKMGIEQTARKLTALVRRKRGYEAYGQGHTLIALFEKPTGRADPSPSLSN